MDMPLHKNPGPEGLQINNFGRPSLDRHNYTLSLADLCLGVEKKIFKRNNAFTVYDLWPCPSRITSCPGGHEIWVDSSLVIITIHYIYSLSEPCPGVEKKILKEIHQLYTFYQNIYSNWDRGGHCFINPCHKLASLLYKCYILNLKKIGLVILEKILMQDDAQHRTPSHSNRSPG